MLAREREEDERWRQRMLDKFAEDDRIGTVHAVHTQYIFRTPAEQYMCSVVRSLYTCNAHMQKTYLQ